MLWLWDLIPLELIFEILLLLPVLTVLRLRVVSKRWQTLIDSPAFKKSHFNHPHSNKLLLQRQGCGGSWMTSKFTHHEFVDLCSFWDCGNETAPMIPQKLRSPACFTDDFTYSLAPVNGVLCAITIDNGALLWNPLIRKHLCVPQPPGSPPARNQRGIIIRHSLWSFCYDTHLDDYKLVYVSRGERFRCSVWVYSVKLDSWQSIGDTPYTVAVDCQPGIFVSGALHFTGWEVSGAAEFIFALDLRNLEYYSVPCPNDAQSRQGFRIGVLDDGCLYFHSIAYVNTGFDLWVMKDYGIKRGSWTKLISLSNESWTNLISSTPPPPHNYRRMLFPIDYVENGKKLIFFEFSSNNVVGYDFETGSFKIVIRDVGVQFLQPHVYTPSLLFPATRNPVCLC